MIFNAVSCMDFFFILLLEKTYFKCPVRIMLLLLRLPVIFKKGHWPSLSISIQI